MAFVEDLSVFLADFGQACTLAGVACTAIVDTEGVEDPETGVITQRPVARLTATEAASAAAGQAFVAGATTYTVRQVLPAPPDGAFVLLVLARN